MISVAAFLSAIQGIASERPTYRNGGSAADGTCDCIGLIIGAIRRAGGKWSGTHGSNYAARNMMQSMDAPLELGGIVYKARGPDDAKYSLPATYAGHPDQRDYYHVGVVTSVNPLKITHCTSWSGGSGIKIDTVIGKWKHGGRLKLVSYDIGNIEDKTMTAKVYARSGSTVRMRVKPDKKAIAIDNVPVGAQVSVLDKRDDWWQVSYNGKTGWMMAEFLRQDSPADPPVIPIDRAAVVAWQRSRGLPATGEVGMRDIEALAQAPVAVKTYRVVIPGMTRVQRDALLKVYPQARAEEEGGS